MINSILTKIVGSKNDRLLKKLQPKVDQINALEPEMQALSDEALGGKRAELMARIEKEKEAGKGVDEALEEVLPEAFAAVREAGRRALGMRHFDVQLIGGIVLHQGKIAEMKTGEGKTLAATLPVFLNSLAGRGVHVVTVNDYLARRDSEWMGRIYKFLGMSVGVIQHDMKDEERQVAYAADVTYGTNNEYGFDYLRDNMKFSMETMAQKDHYYAIVDEVDSILIDEARTPLIISGPAEESTEKYAQINRIIPKLKKGAVTQGGTVKGYEIDHTGDYIVDEKARTVTLTETGNERCQELLGIDNIYDPANMEIIHHVNQALKAHVLFKRDVDYMIKDGQVMIVDEFTGRLMPGRRWSDGLHQAVEAKEGVKIERENQTLATITFQNYFRSKQQQPTAWEDDLPPLAMYEKLAGMTGTADTESVEFGQIYGLEVVVIPTNQALIRIENPDVVYRTEKEKWEAVADEIADCQERGQPALVGTISIEKSETLSTMLRRRGIKHVVLNAKYHEMEAEIVAQAGRLGAMTIATNMAGRGTDILLGGNPEFLARQKLTQGGLKPGEIPEDDWDRAYAEALESTKKSSKEEHDRVVEAGGLHILGTERHESRRIDNQLRGRAGRQGDPGSSRFFLSLEDDLMRIFAGDKLRAAMKSLGMEEGVPIESPMVSRAIERAQKQVEQRNLEIRKHLLKYDNVNNRQRTEVYSLRRGLLEGKEQNDYVLGKAREILEFQIDENLAAFKDPGDWQVESLHQQVLHQFGTDPDHEGIRIRELSLAEIEPAIWEKLEARYAAKETKVGPDLMRHYERHILLQIIDASWKDHLLAMDHLKEGIGLRAYGQRDPLVEFKKESFDMFSQMKDRIENDAIRFLFHLEPMTEEDRRREDERRRREQEQIFAAASRAKAGVTAKGGITTVKRKTAKVGRNDPCPCGSGKKYKKCHGATGAA